MIGQCLLRKYNSSSRDCDVQEGTNEGTDNQYSAYSWGVFAANISQWALQLTCGIICFVFPWGIQLRSTSYYLSQIEVVYKY